MLVGSHCRIITCEIKARARAVRVKLQQQSEVEGTELLLALRGPEEGPRSRSRATACHQAMKSPHTKKNTRGDRLTLNRLVGLNWE